MKSGSHEFNPLLEEQLTKDDVFPMEDMEAPAPCAPDKVFSQDLIFFFCAVGIVSSMTCYGIILEYITADGRKLDEIQFLFVTASIATIAAYILRWFFGGVPNEGNKLDMFTLSITTMASMYTSLRSLRYVIFPMQVLFHACKPVPVILFGNCFGKTYHAQKYAYVCIVIIGVVLFIGGGDSDTDNTETDASVTQSSLVGICMLIVSTCLEGGTSAYEEKLMSKQQVEEFQIDFFLCFST